MKTLVTGLCLGWFGVLASAGVSDAESLANSDSAPESNWRVHAWAEDAAVSNGLPVLSLNRTDWYRGLRGLEEPSKAAQRLQGGVEAMHPSGWRMGWVGRSQVQLTMSRDTVALAQLDASGQDPVAGRSFAVQYQASGWTGQGLSVGTPWWPVASALGLRASLDVQWLQLSKLRRDALSGAVSYSGAGAYDALLNADRVGTQIKVPFLPSSDARGWGGSVSLALEAEPVPEWHMGLRADDLWSRLSWGRLARETSVLNTQVTTRAPDGTLDFAPPVRGLQQLSQVKASMGTRWTATVRRALRDDDASWGQWNAKWTHWAGMDETWLGWQSRAAPAGWQWHWALEPRRGVVAVGAQWRGLQVGLATDGRSTSATQYRQWFLNWSHSL